MVSRPGCGAAAELVAFAGQREQAVRSGTHVPFSDVEDPQSTSCRDVQIQSVYSPGEAAEPKTTVLYMVIYAGFSSKRLSKTSSCGGHRSWSK